MTWHCALFAICTDRMYHTNTGRWEFAGGFGTLSPKQRYFRRLVGPFFIRSKP